MKLDFSPLPHPPLLPSLYKPCCKVSKFLFSRIKNFKYWSVVSLNILFKFRWEDHGNVSLAWWLNIRSILKLFTWGFLSILFNFEILGLMVAYFDYQFVLSICKLQACSDHHMIWRKHFFCNPSINSFQGVL